MKTTFDLHFYFYYTIFERLIHINMENKKKLSIYSFSLFTCKLVVRKKTSWKSKFKLKSRLH